MSPTTYVAAGSGVVEGVGRYAATYGARALLVVGEGHARASGVVARVEGALRADGLAVEILEGVGANPSTTVVDAGAMLARTWRADVIVALGGGSVLDVAKAVATSAAAPEPRPFAEHLSGIRAPGHLVDAALPVVAVPTLAGSGSETNGTSVIIDEASGRKLSAQSDLAAPRVALLDPVLLRDAPPQLLGAGLVDGLCHAIESALSARASIASDALAEQAMRILVRVGDPTCADVTQRDDQLMAAWWATNLAGQALTLAGSIVTHPLAHPLSARLDARHGEAVAALEAAVLATFADRFAAAGSLQRVARWLDVRNADDPAAALRGVLTKLSRYCAVNGVRRSAADLGLVDALVGPVIRDARASGSRGLANLPGGEPDPEELFRVLDAARACGPAAPTKQLLAAVEDARVRAPEDAATPADAHPTRSQLPR